MWLPLAHPVAPTPASAVLSGAMIKAGLVGWLATLPLGLDATPAFVGLGRAMLVTGLVGAIGAALLGVCQRHPKAVLAYSSVSQMGMLGALVGAGLLAPAAWPALSAAVVLFAAHHGLTKGALFLGVGASEHPPRLPDWLLALLLGLPALSLAGALGSGLVTKWAFKSALYEAGLQPLVDWLSLAAVGTTLLVARALWLQWQSERQTDEAERLPCLAPLPLAWLLLLASALTLPLWLGALTDRSVWPPLDELAGLLWPVGVGVAVALAAGRWVPRRASRLSHRLPAGDLWWPLVNVASGLATAIRPALRQLVWVRNAWVAWWLARERNGVAWFDGLVRSEAWLRQHAAVLMMTVAAVLALVSLLGPA